MAIIANVNAKRQLRNFYAKTFLGLSGSGTLAMLRTNVGESPGA